jgi:hypothetical protein
MRHKQEDGEPNKTEQQKHQTSNGSIIRHRLEAYHIRTGTSTFPALSPDGAIY